MHCNKIDTHYNIKLRETALGVTLESISVTVIVNLDAR